MPKCDFNKVAKHTSAWVLSYKFAGFFLGTFLKIAPDGCSEELILLLKFLLRNIHTNRQHSN